MFRELDVITKIFQQRPTKTDHSKSNSIKKYSSYTVNVLK